MFTMHPSVLTEMINLLWIVQAIVAASASMIDSAVMGTKYRQCHSRSVRRQTKGAPSLMVASVASSLLQVKKTGLTPSPPPPPRNHKILALNFTGLVRTEYMRSFGSRFALIATSGSRRWSRSNRTTDRRRRSFFT
jgi:hypothetical protein